MQAESVSNKPVSAVKTRPGQVKPDSKIKTQPGQVTTESKQVKRTVLVLDFVNQSRADDVAYLSVSLAEAFINPLEKTTVFELLSRDLSRKTAEKLDLKPEDLFSDENAVQIGRDAEANVVLIGSFIRMEGKIMIQAKAIDVNAGRVSVTQSRESNIDISLFKNIETLAKDMADAMKNALPMLTQSAAMKQQMKGTFTRTAATAQIGTIMGAGTSGKFLSNGYGLKASYSHRIFDLIFHPIYQAGFAYLPGIDPMRSMTQFGLSGGVLLPMKLNRDLTVGVYLLAGMLAGKVDRGRGFSYNLPCFDFDFLADYFVARDWSLTFSLGGSYLLDKTSSLLFGNFQAGLSRHFQ